MPVDNTRKFSRFAMRSCAGLALSVALMAALLTVGAFPASAATPTVVGKVTGKLPPSARNLTEIQAFDDARGALVVAKKLNRSGTFRLALPPGGYVLVTSITPKRGRSRAGVQRVTPVTLAVGQRRGGVKISKPTARSSATRSPGARAAFSQESGAITPGEIAFSIERFSGATGVLSVFNHGLTDMLITDLMSTPCRFVQVANSSDRGVIEQELTLQKSKYVDPSTRVTRNFIAPDIVVRGRLQTLGNSLGYALTLVDGRTGTTLETLSGALPESTIFEAEPRLAAELGKRLCAYGEVFEVTFTGEGTANFATHLSTGTLNAETITAKPTATDSGGPTRWEGSAPISWTNLALTSHTPGCSLINPVSGQSTWTAKLERVGEALQVMWLADTGSDASATMFCSDGNGGGDSTPGMPAVALLDSRPNPFILPANAEQAVTGPGLDGQGYGWNNTLELKVKTIRVEPLG